MYILAARKDVLNLTCHTLRQDDIHNLTQGFLRPATSACRARFTFAVQAVLPTVGCSAAPLASIHYTPVAPPLSV